MNQMLVDNKSFTSEEFALIWEKAEKDTPENEVKGFRKDAVGAWIKKSDYADRSSRTNYGWEVDHIVPKSQGGTDDISNLRPLHWMNNVAKNDNYPKWQPAVKSDGDKNREI